MINTSPQHFGEAGKPAWFLHDGRWMPGTAWWVDASGAVEGTCRDYGSLALPYPARAPIDVDGSWPASQVRWLPERQTGRARALIRRVLADLARTLRPALPGFAQHPSVDRMA